MTSKFSSRIKPVFITVFPWLITGIAIVGVIVIMTPRSAVIKTGDEAWLNSSADGVSGLPLPVEPVAQDSRGEGFGGIPAQGSDPAPLPVDSVSALRSDPPGDSMGSDVVSSTATEPASDAPQQPGTTSGNQSPAEILPPPATGSDKVSASNIQDIETSNTSAESAGAATVVIKEPASISTEIPPQETLRKSGPWVINLASSGNKDNAERFRAKARARDIAADLSRVTVKGKDYWRVQVPGFATAAEAQAAAESIKEKLGLDEVWIVKQ
jgi:cell division septation protein DedD